MPKTAPLRKSPAARASALFSSRHRQWRLRRAGATVGMLSSFDSGRGEPDRDRCPGANFDLLGFGFCTGAPELTYAVGTPVNGKRAGNDVVFAGRNCFWTSRRRMNLSAPKPEQDASAASESAFTGMSTTSASLTGVPSPSATFTIIRPPSRATTKRTAAGSATVPGRNRVFTMLRPPVSDVLQIQSNGKANHCEDVVVIEDRRAKFEGSGNRSCRRELTCALRA